MAEESQRTVAEQQRIAALFKKMHLFKGLDDQALEKIIARFTTREAKIDERIFAEGQFAEGFFIILEGQVDITRDLGKGVTVTIAHMMAGDYFGEMALINRTLRTGSARAQETTTLLEMSNENFRWFMEEFSQIRKDLMRITKGYEVAQRKRFKWLREDETIHVLARRDVMILVYQLLPVIGVGLLGLLFLFFSNQMASPILRFLGAISMLIALGWGLWSYVDWENDFYVVTDKRVVYVEKIILLYDSIQEAPLETIQTLNVSSANFIERLLGYGHVTVETFGSKIHMQGVRDPARVETAIKEYWDRAASTVKQRKEEDVRREVRQRLGLEAPPKPAAAKPATEKQPTPRKSFLEDLLQIRVVEGGVITYRKHWFTLVIKIWPVVLALAVFLGLIIARAMSVFTIVSFAQLFGTFFVILLASSPYVIYQYLDWRDDRYQLTNREVIDLERKPFQAEIRDSAPLENILSIQHKRDNLLKLILNFGTVSINAGNKELTFDDIYNPAAVQSEIFEQRLRRVNQIQADKDRGNREHIERLVDLYAEYLPEYLEKQNPPENPETKKG